MIWLHKKLGGTTFLKKVVPVVLLEFIIQDWVLRKSGSLNFIKSTTFMQKVVPTFCSTDKGKTI